MGGSAAAGMRRGCHILSIPPVWRWQAEFDGSAAEAARNHGPFGGEKVRVGAPPGTRKLGVSVHFLSAIGFKGHLRPLKFRHGAESFDFLAEKMRECEH